MKSSSESVKWDSIIHQTHNHQLVLSSVKNCDLKRPDDEARSLIILRSLLCIFWLHFHAYSSSPLVQPRRNGAQRKTRFLLSAAERHSSLLSCSSKAFHKLSKQVSILQPLPVSVQINRNKDVGLTHHEARIRQSPGEGNMGGEREIRGWSCHASHMQGRCDRLTGEIGKMQWFYTSRRGEQKRGEERREEDMSIITYARSRHRPVWHHLQMHQMNAGFTVRVSWIGKSLSASYLEQNVLLHYLCLSSVTENWMFGNKLRVDRSSIFKDTGIFFYGAWLKRGME